MKKYNLILLLFVALVGCTIDDYNQPSDFSKPQVFTTGIYNISASTIANSIPISIDDFSSLTDVSQGVVSRYWVIENGTRFLNSEFTRKDSLDLARFIDPELGNIHWKDVVHVLFQEEGETTVTLKNKFNKAVSLYGNDAVQTTDGLWELTTVFKYDVYAKLNAEASVKNLEDGKEVILAANQNPSIDNTSGFTTITIEAGSKLTFKDLTTIGRPSDRIWDFKGGQPATSTEIEQVVTYNRVGEYTAILTVSRAKKGNKTLRYSEQTKAIPVIVKVIPSTKPFTINGNAFAVADTDNIPGTKNIAFRVNGILESFTGLTNNFSVNVVNGSFNQNFTVTSAKVSSTDETMIELELAQPILNSDTVKLSYNGTAIKAIDDRQLLPFTNATVSPLLINYLANAFNPSFEEASQSSTTGAQSYTHFVVGNNLSQITNADGSLYAARSTEKASDGSASMKYNLVLPLITTQGYFGLINNTVSNSNIPTGDYKLTFDVFIESGNFMGIFNAIQGASSSPSGVGIPFNTPATGEWFTLERTFSVNGTLGGNVVFNVRNADNSGVTGTQVFYIDNLKVLKVETR
ncbi:hypothetical protein EV196_103303 [Mariniflexile fucanivorans]|uniref:PKD domain-containing protein n=1 Tax=Mariniflexile fucanivorans TaxID=264023 RepID=A0A4R1RL11_9FLAO|nr:PKD domain-containing protein [Mariniflexile fucanivorans]TCL66884.1 hypothetical protein EV196_103303 [Mariniflexile fucanivorans]